MITENKTRTKRNKKDSTVPSLYINSHHEEDFAYKFNSTGNIAMLFERTYTAINEAVENENEIAYLLELNYSGNYKALPKSGWGVALNRTLVFHEGNENYIECAKVRDLISKL